MIEQSKEIELGSQVKCTVTGFKGVAYSRVIWLNGCIRIEVQPKVNKKGEWDDSKYIDESQLEVISPPKKKTAKKKITGGAMSSSPSMG